MQNQRLCDFLIIHQKEFTSNLDNFENDTFAINLREVANNNRLKFQNKWTGFKTKLSESNYHVFDDSIDVSRSFCCYSRIGSNLFILLDVSLIGEFFSCYLCQYNEGSFLLELAKPNTQNAKDISIIKNIFQSYFNYSFVDSNDFVEKISNVFVEGYYESSFGIHVHRILYGISKLSIND